MIRNKKICIFFTEGLIGYHIRSALIPGLIQMGLDPVLFSGGKPSRLQSVLSRGVKDIYFIEDGILTDSIIPYVNSCSFDQPTTMKQYADHYGLDFYENMSPNSNEVLTRIQSDPSIIGGLSIRNYHILRKPLIDAFTEKFLWNLHGGTLPEYKGFLIPFYVKARGESDYGWTLHEINEGIDTGPIIEVMTRKIDENLDILPLYLSMAKDAANMILEKVQDYLDGVRIETKTQPSDSTSYFPSPSDKTLKEWESQGIKFVDLGKVPDMYASSFAEPGSPTYIEVKNLTIQALGDRFNAQKDLKRAQNGNLPGLSFFKPG